MIVQPTRLGPNKRVAKAISLANEVQRRLPDRNVYLVCGGGSDNEEDGQRRRTKLLKYAHSLGFCNLILLGWSGRMYDYMAAADIVTYMSSTETRGIPPAESAFLGVPLVTSRFTDYQGEQVFDDVYGEFRFIMEGGGDETISIDSVNKVLRIIADPSSWQDNRQHNYRLAHDLSTDSNVQRFKKILGTILS